MAGSLHPSAAGDDAAAEARRAALARAEEAEAEAVAAAIERDAATRASAPPWSALPLRRKTQKRTRLPSPMALDLPSTRPWFFRRLPLF